jgi:pimeloyl-ACP methyl ester carboxylesterase
VRAAFDPKVAARMSALALRDELAGRRGGEPVRVPTAGPPGSVALMTAPDALAGVEALAAGHDIDHSVSARISSRIGLYRPGRALRRDHPPTLLCVCDKDTVAPAKAAIRHAHRGRDVELRRYPIGHFEIYWGEWFERAVADQLEFLRRHLSP